MRTFIAYLLAGLLAASAVAKMLEHPIRRHDTTTKPDIEQTATPSYIPTLFPYTPDPTPCPMLDKECFRDLRPVAQ